MLFTKNVKMITYLRALTNLNSLQLQSTQAITAACCKKGTLHLETKGIPCGPHRLSPLSLEMWSASCVKDEAE